jgi:hypothetical protein
MAWPLSRLPPGLGGAKSFEATLCGDFYFFNRKGKKVIFSNLFRKDVLPRTRKRILFGLDFFRDLPLDVIDKLSRATETRVKHLVYTWRAIEDNCRLASPVLQNCRENKLIYRLWRWCICSHVHNPNIVLEHWKQAMLHIRRFVAGDREQSVPFPREVPEGKRGRIGFLWLETFPFLWDVFFEKPLTKYASEMVTMLTQTRNFPVPVLTAKQEKEDILQFQKELQKPKVDIPPWVYSVSSSIGKDCNEGLTRDLFPHISVSFSASRDFTRAQGGKGIELLKFYTERYVYSNPDETVLGQTWFGREYKAYRGIPKLYTMCRSSPLDVKFTSFLCSSFRTFDAPNTMVELFLNGVYSSKQLEEPIFGLDREFAPQLYQMSLEILIDEGFLGELPPLFDYNCVKKGIGSVVGKKPIPCRAHCVREPGGKIRWVTMEPSYVNVACQPLAHMLAGLLNRVPALYSAFNRSWKAWDLVDMMSIRDPNTKQKDWSVGVYDLTSASNNLDKGVMRCALEAFLNAIYGGSVTWCYIEIILSLIFRDRDVTIYEDLQEKKILHQFKASNGLLMGNAGTKEILVLASELIHRKVKYDLTMGLRRSFIWLIAGDDVGMYASRETFDKVLKTHRQLGNVIQDKKTFFSHRWVPFCQGGIYLDSVRLFWNKRLKDLEYSEQACTDTIMSRLLVPFGIESLEGNPTARNPVIGKGAALRKLLDYFPQKEIVPMVIRIFHRNMGSLMSRDVMNFLPGSIGGYDCPHLIPKEDLWKWMIRDLHPIIYPLFNILISRERTPIWVDFLLRRCRTGISTKGLENPTLDALIQSYEAALTTHAMVPGLCWTELELQLAAQYRESGRNPELIDAKDVRKYAKRQNLMNGYGFAEIVDRSSAIRIFFLVAMEKIPLERALPQRGILKSPTEILKGFYESELPARIKHDYVSDIKSLFSHGKALEGFDSFKAWFWGGLRPINTDFGNLYLSKDCYIDSLNAMKVPIWEPRNPQEPFVKGSLEDPHRDLEQDLFIGTVVTLQRLR